MSHYQLRYRVQTCLRREENISITFGAHTVKLLFAEKEAEGGTNVIAELEVEAENNRDAQFMAAESVIPPVLDALSFSTGTPLLLENCEIVLKNEIGSELRHILYLAKRRMAASVELSDEDIAGAGRLLASSGKQEIALLWHRYAMHRQSTLNSFIFQWLAFESLARTHRGRTMQRAFELFKAVGPAYEKDRFDKEIWGKMRNSVFHGERYPGIAFLRQIMPVINSLRRACEMEISNQHKVVAGKQRQEAIEQAYHVQYYLSWKTKTPDEAFAQDYPRAMLAQSVQEAEPGKREENFPEFFAFNLAQGPYSW